MSAMPRSLDEMARIDGHRLPYFFFRIFLPTIKSGIGVTVFFCFMFSWVELLLARTLTGSDAKPIVVVMTRTVSASGIDWGVLAAAGVLTILPGSGRGLVRAASSGEGVCVGEGLVNWMAWTLPTALFFVVVACALVLDVGLGTPRPGTRRGLLPLVTTRGDRFFITLLSSAYLHARGSRLGRSGLDCHRHLLVVGFVLMRWG